MIVECKDCKRIKLVNGVKKCSMHGEKSNDRDKVICGYYKSKHKSK